MAKPSSVDISEFEDAVVRKGSVCSFVKLPLTPEQQNKVDEVMKRHVSDITATAIAKVINAWGEAAEPKFSIGSETVARHRRDACACSRRK